MNSVPTIYWGEIRAKFGRLPVWLPGTRITLGDVGVLSPTRWERTTTLADLGVRIVFDQPGAAVEYDFASAQGVTVKTQLAGQRHGPIPGLPGGAAGFQATFSRAGACVFRAAQVRVQQIGNLDDVERAVLDLYAAGRWRKEWTYVTETAVGGPSCVLVAKDKSANAVVSLGLSQPAGTASLASANAGLQLSSQSAMACAFVAAEQTTVLWSGRYVNDAWYKFRGPQGAIRGDDTTRTAAAPADTDAQETKAQVLSIEHPDDNPPPAV